MLEQWVIPNNQEFQISNSWYYLFHSSKQPQEILYLTNKETRGWIS